MSHDAPTDREAEIALLNHELEILRTRYALYEKCARIVRIAFLIWLPAVVILAVAALGKSLVVDAAIIIFLAAIFGCLCLALWLWCQLDPRGVRWIDVVSPNRLMPNSGRGLGSDARMIEDQIAEREQRLAELGSTATRPT